MIKQQGDNVDNNFPKTMTNNKFKQIWTKCTNVNSTTDMKLYLNTV